jgi:hypothetical protein
LTGTRWNAARSGKGFLPQSGDVPGTTSLTMLASFHTCNSKGNQA